LIVHEYAVVEGLLAAVERTVRAHGGGTVRRIVVEVGELAGLEVPLFETAYRTFRERTVCGEAELEVRRVAASWSCPRCEQELPRGSVLRCAACGVPAVLAQGGDLLLRDVEMEVARV
jgi:hydrogenase nickel incorporation protein HypA/HybF